MMTWKPRNVPDPLAPARGILLGVALGLVLWLTLVGLMLVALAPPATASSDVCPPGDSGKVDVGSQPSVTVTAPEGFLISGYCVKAGNDLDFVTVDPPQQTVTIVDQDGAGCQSGKPCDVSHYSLTYVAVSNPSPSPSPSPTPSETPSESPSPNPSPSGSPVPNPHPSPTESPTLSESPSPTPEASLIPPKIIERSGPGSRHGGSHGGSQVSARPLAYTGFDDVLPWIIVALMLGGAGWATLRIGQRRGRD